MLTEEQFSYLAKKYMDMVFRLALHYTKSRSESDDITQEVLLKLYREGYSCEEISKFLGIPNATVRTRLRRGREQLKTDLQEANNDV